MWIVALPTTSNKQTKNHHRIVAATTINHHHANQIIDHLFKKSIKNIFMKDARGEDKIKN